MILRIKERAKLNTGVLVSIYVILLILTPSVNIGIGVPFRLDDIFLLFLVARMPKNIFLRLSFSSTVLLCFCLSSFVSLIAGFAGGSTFSFSDINDVLVALRLFLIVNVVQYFVRSTENIHQIFIWLYRAICISAVVAALQYFRIQPFALFLVSLYSQGGEKYLSGLAGYTSVWRVVSTYGNPNYTGLFFVIGAIFSLHMIAQRLGRSAIHGMIFMIFVMLCLLSVSSRTSLVLLLVCSGFYVGLYLYVNRTMSFKNVRMCVMVVCASVLLYYVYSLFPAGSFPTRVTNLLEASGSGTHLYEILLRSRETNWDWTLRELRMSNMWVVGNGPGPGFVIDSEYLYILYTQGIVGLCLTSLLWLWPVLTFRKLRSQASRNLAVYVLTILMALAFFGVNAPVFSHPKVGPIIAVFLGIWQVLLKDSKQFLATSKYLLEKNRRDIDALSKNHSCADHPATFPRVSRAALSAACDK